MSRKYHKLVVVPLRASTPQIYQIQQRLLSVVNPALMSSQANLIGVTGINQSLKPLTRLSGTDSQKYPSSRNSKPANRAPQSRNHLVPGYLIMENRPLAVNCNITDEHVLRLLRENQQFKLKWYKNGKQLRGFYALPASGGHLLSPINLQATSGGRRSESSRGRSSQQANSLGSSGSVTSALGIINPQSRASAQSGFNQRVQFLQANGRQLYINGAQYSDAGDYSCLWSGLEQVSFCYHYHQHHHHHHIYVCYVYNTS